MIGNLLKKVKKMMESNYVTIDANEAKRLIKEKNNIQIIDVRTPQEVRGGKVNGSINADIFSPDFRTKVEKLDKSKPTIVYCRSGNRSRSACSVLARQGFGEVYNVSGGYMAWST